MYVFNVLLICRLPISPVCSGFSSISISSYIHESEPLPVMANSLLGAETRYGTNVYPNLAELAGFAYTRYSPVLTSVTVPFPFETSIVSSAVKAPLSAMSAAVFAIFSQSSAVVLLLISDIDLTSSSNCFVAVYASFSSTSATL